MSGYPGSVVWPCGPLQTVVIDTTSWVIGPVRPGAVIMRRAYIESIARANQFFNQLTDIQSIKKPLHKLQYPTANKARDFDGIPRATRVGLAPWVKITIRSFAPLSFGHWAMRSIISLMSVNYNPHIKVANVNLLETTRERLISSKYISLYNPVRQENCYK